ncbi:MAG TPA: 50S ribosomal protein L4 [Gemmatimonadales bacterium]|nr:50S ribosomal protein L4 [Gemmatimonadales bacterium]
MIEAPLYSAAGARLKTPFALPAETFDGTVHQPVLHEAVKVYLNNQRQGTQKAKTRAEVSGGNQKPWKQKGTGRARQGTTRAPHWRGGGVAFAPTPRDYRTGIPKKVRQLARKSALNARAADGLLAVVERLDFASPKTKEMTALLGKLGFEGRKVLVLTHGINTAAYLSARNLPRAGVLPYTDASAYDILWADALVVEQGALGGEVLPATEAAAAPTKTKKAAKPKAAKAAKAKAAPKKKAAPKAKAPKVKAPKAGARRSTARKAAPKKKGSE